MMKVHKMLLTDPELVGRAWMVLQVHDELILEVQDDVVPQAAKCLADAMRGAAVLQVPLEVKIGMGKSWGALKPLSVEDVRGWWAQGNGAET